MVLQGQRCQRVEALFEALRLPGSQAVYVPIFYNVPKVPWRRGLPWNVRRRLATSAHQRYTKTQKVKVPCSVDITSTHAFKGQALNGPARIQSRGYVGLGSYLVPTRTTVGERY
ncbi:hypothetical protein FVEG_16530 [Fusarium verticillioides 7600]|uniref:Uncharacterized protein n=1 Tax=Gibberella moniliformis (strain M3125 / FGSC 7600) TaxID=334819 RepID=W7MFJ1_GIBM7|nr:hypothetical protein FVEG_16530 [Fusarium verticillioides 7600]XP_018755903.1 hypothetical protein FVEG_16530 [Fusarium verticillioides 7600]EWG49711.1 hypothetical protein FVEG_16530 [Fusarium verticillioides 7600]EWG49712.1 hypothetical protein FVEG_16530 [Fusarium verticillioides 7600]